ncbi:TPA: hypothetical protein ACH3X1_015569 [Trebouxia sp. C0004]
MYGCAACQHCTTVRQVCSASFPRCLALPSVRKHARSGCQSSRYCSGTHEGLNPARGALTCRTSATEDDALQLDVPDIDNDLESYQGQLGAVFNDAGFPMTFDNTQEALEALQTSCCVTDMSNWDRLHISGRDRLTFLHGQSTFDCARAQPGSAFDTVFVTPQGRCLELARCLVQSQGLLVLVSPGSGVMLAARLAKYILYGDEVSVVDVTSKTKMFSLTGPLSSATLEGLEAAAPGPNCVALMGFQGSPVLVAEGSGLAAPGYTLVVDEQAAGELWRNLTLKGAKPMGEVEWEMARILQGRPAAGKELTEQHIPLEAGLYHAVSLNKGCYMGQETLAKVHKLNAVKQQLQGLVLDGGVQAGTPLLSGSEKAGTVTSVTQLPDGSHIGLGYVRCRANGRQIAVEGLHLTAAGVAATVVSRPYGTWHFPEGQGVEEPAPDAAEDFKDRALAAK